MIVSIVESRFELFKAALLVDQAMLLRQAMNEFNLTLTQICVRGFGVFDVHYSSARRTYKMKVVSYQKPEPDVLIHQLGTAMMRFELGVGVADWIVVTAVNEVNPDAVWRASDGLVGIEFDAGNYSRQRVIAKAQQMAVLYSRQIWGVFGEDRATTLRRYLAQIQSQNISVIALDFP
jgi:hypothetical protein